MIDDVVQVYKVVTIYSLILAVAFEKNYNPQHFILPMPVAEMDMFAYAKVFYGLLDRLQARWCLRTLVKIHEAQSELHGIFALVVTLLCMKLFSVTVPVIFSMTMSCPQETLKLDYMALPL